MSFYVVIPARFAATRLPGKLLLDINGKPMLQHVYERARSSNASEVFIATDDARIYDTASDFGARVVMTSADHRSGTDRIQELASLMEFSDDDVVVNVQGDEPLIPPAAINRVADNLTNNPEAGISSLCEIINSQSGIADSNCVKVVLDARSYALYFSRSTIPWQASANARNCYRHIGIYGYRVAVLNQFTGWSPSALEAQEKLEQLRALHHGVKIHMEIVDLAIPPGVDTEEDLVAVRLQFSSSKKQD